MKIAVYTALFADKDVAAYKKPSSLLKIPPNINGYDFIPFLGVGSRANARRIKCLPHKYLSEYDVSIWIDGTIKIIANDIVPIIEKYLKDANMVVIAHPVENLSLYDEAGRCKQFGKGDPVKIDQQIDFYKKEGCPKTQEVVATPLVIRRHNEPEIIKFDEAWLYQIQRYSIRDQISFPYVAWKQNLKYNKIYSTHPLTKTLGIMGTYWFERSFF